MFGKIPRKREMSMRTALREVKREEAEKLRFFQPPIPFVPEESHYESCDKKELVLLVNPTASNSVDKKSTIKKSFPVLKSGTVEDYLKWTNDMWYIVKNKPCTSAGSKFDLIKCFLAEEALEEWQTCEATVTNKIVPGESESESSDDDQEDPKTSESGTKQNPVETLVGQTDETFKECIQLFLDQRIPAGSARKQKTYMRSHLRKPVKLDIKVVARRLKEMSYKIPLLGGPNSKSLDDSELTDILVRMCPQAWRVKYAEQTAGLEQEPTLEYSIKYLATLEHTSALVQASKPDGNKRKKSGQDDKSKTKKHKSGKKHDKKDKFCQICKDAGRPEWLYTNHNTKDCKKKGDNQGKTSKDRYKGSVKKHHEKMFASFLEYEKRRSKKSKKKSKKHQEASSDSDSDSDSS